jgi:hypothetical protein
MHLVYLDESGNSGMNLSDPAQPMFSLCAMIVAEKCWHALEQELMHSLDGRFKNWRSTDDFEIHGSDLRTGRGVFKGISVTERIAFQSEWMTIGEGHGIKLICRSIHKRQYATWLNKTFGAGILINPHVAAFALVARCVDNYLASLPEKPLGMLISDDNKEVVADVEKSIKVLRGTAGALKLKQIVEKGFFVDSAKSLPLQLCDLFTLSLRKADERKALSISKPFDDAGIEIANRMRQHDTQHDTNVLQWLTEQHQRKKEAASGSNP